MIDVFSGEDLLIAFGATVINDPKGAEKATAELGRKIVATLQAHGVRCSWSGSARERIRIEAFEWKRRRWTTSPEYELCIREDPPKQSRLWRLLGKKARHEDPLYQEAFMVRTCRDERGFYVARANQVRAAWKAAGNTSRGQCRHLGLPHAFVRAGEYTTMQPQSAIMNLLKEKDKIVEHGTNARVS